LRINAGYCLDGSSFTVEHVFTWLWIITNALQHNWGSFRHFVTQFRQVFKTLDCLRFLWVLYLLSVFTRGDFVRFIVLQHRMENGLVSFTKYKEIIKFQLHDAENYLNPLHIFLVLLIIFPAPPQVGFFTFQVLLMALVVSSLLLIDAPFKLEVILGNDSEELNGCGGLEIISIVFGYDLRIYLISPKYLHVYIREHYFFRNTSSSCEYTIDRTRKRWDRQHSERYWLISACLWIERFSFWYKF